MLVTTAADNRLTDYQGRSGATDLLNLHGD
jgi:hypothetical protein